MKNLLVSLSIAILFGCKNEPKELAFNEHPAELIAVQNALDIPVGKLGVYVLIDSVGVFKQDNEKFDTTHTTKLTNDLQNIFNSLRLDSIVKTNTQEFLKIHQKEFTILSYPNSSVDKELFSSNVAGIDFNKYMPKEKVDDLLFVALRSGINYENQKEIDGKTNIYITIVDPKNNQIKYNEVISGSKYLDEKDYKTKQDYLKNLMLQSVQTTIDLIKSTK